MCLPPCMTVSSAKSHSVLRSGHNRCKASSRLGPGRSAVWQERRVQLTGPGEDFEFSQCKGKPPGGFE